MNNWHRNLFAMDRSPDVPMDARLVVVEDGGPAALGDRVAVQWMDAVGLDRSVKRRGGAGRPPPPPGRAPGGGGVRGVQHLAPPPPSAGAPSGHAPSAKRKR